MASRYRVVLKAINIPIKNLQEQRRGGIFATRFLSADSNARAAEIAKSNLLNEARLSAISEVEAVRESLEVICVDKVPWFEGRVFGGRGFTIAIEE